MKANHYAAVILDSKGRKLKGYDFRRKEDADEQRTRLEERGHITAVWEMDVYGQRLFTGENALRLAERVGLGGLGQLAVRELGEGPEGEPLGAAAGEGLRPAVA